MRKEYILPGIAVVGGAVGLALRRWQMQAAFEPDTGLPILGHPSIAALTGLSCFVAVLLLLMTGRRHRPFGEFRQAFSMASPAALMLQTAAAFLIGIAGLWNAFKFLQHEVPAIRMLLGVFCLASAVCLLFMAKSLYRSAPVRKILPLVPGYTCCVWLMACYQEWAKDPAQSHYIFSLLAILGGMLTCYFIASFCFQNPKVLLTCVVGLLTVYFSLVTLLDGCLRADFLLYLAFICYLIPTISTLLYHDGRREAPAEEMLRSHPDFEKITKEDTP